MDNLTDFDNTEDVSDAAIEWLVNACDDEQGGHRTPEYVRENSRNRFWARSVMLSARLIQRHHPELLLDPVDAAVDEFMKTEGFFLDRTREAAKRLYLMGIEKGKAG